MMPVLKADVAVLTSSGVDANTEYQESDYGDDFDGGKPELGLAVEIHWHEIERRNDHPERAYEDADVQVWSPVLDDQPAEAD